MISNSMLLFADVSFALVAEYVFFNPCNSLSDILHILFFWLEKKWEYNETLHQLFIDLEKAYDSVRREVEYSDRDWGTRGNSQTD
jgi:hypothetical protein